MLLSVACLLGASYFTPLVQADEPQRSVIRANIQQLKATAEQKNQTAKDARKAAQDAAKAAKTSWHIKVNLDLKAWKLLKIIQVLIDFKSESPSPELLDRQATAAEAAAAAAQKAYDDAAAAQAAQDAKDRAGPVIQFHYP